MPDTPFPLGRLVKHDERSRLFRTPAPQVPLRSVTWTPPAVLNQGSLGACVGYASAAQANCGPVGAVLDADQRARYGNGEGLAIYQLATTLDDIDGTYPPTDTGSSGLGGAKAAKAQGLISGYLHAFGLTDALTALQHGPVMFGTNWYEAMFNPAPDGIITIGGDVAGGHEYMCYGVDTGLNVLLCQNSWGTDWGSGGRFRISTRSMDRLLGEDGDCTQFVPLSHPAPTPEPPGPVHDPLDVMFAKVLRPWAKRPHILDNRRVAAAARHWLDAKGL